MGSLASTGTCSAVHLNRHPLHSLYVHIGAIEPINILLAYLVSMSFFRPYYEACEKIVLIILALRSFHVLWTKLLLRLNIQKNKIINRFHAFLLVILRLFLSNNVVYVAQILYRIHCSKKTGKQVYH